MYIAQSKTQPLESAVRQCHFNSTPCMETITQTNALLHSIQMQMYFKMKYILYISESIHMTMPPVFIRNIYLFYTDITNLTLELQRMTKAAVKILSQYKISCLDYSSEMHLTLVQIQLELCSNIQSTW